MLSSNEYEEKWEVEITNLEAQNPLLLRVTTSPTTTMLITIPSTLFKNITFT